MLLGHRHDVPALLHLADGPVSASPSEGFGMAVLEAMAAAKPVVALHTPAFDEFARVDAIKGQGKARMSAAANRRSVVVDGLTACPVGRWFAVEDFFRLLRATGRSFVVAHETHELYIAEHYYGNLGYDDSHAWEQLQGRFVLAFLFALRGVGAQQAVPLRFSGEHSLVRQRLVS